MICYIYCLRNTFSITIFSKVKIQPWIIDQGEGAFDLIKSCCVFLHYYLFQWYPLMNFFYSSIIEGTGNKWGATLSYFPLNIFYPSIQVMRIFATFCMLYVIGSRNFTRVFRWFSKVCSLFFAEGFSLEFYGFTSLIWCLDSWFDDFWIYRVWCLR